MSSTSAIRKTYLAIGATGWLLASTMAHAATPDSPSVTFSGRVTEPSGVNGIGGAVVSIEWHVVPSKPAQGSVGTPTVLAVWQGRTDNKGAFSIAVESLVLPTGVSPAPDAFPRLQVFAVNHAPYRTSVLQERVSIDRNGRALINWPDKATNIRLIYQRETPQDLNAQFTSWTAELDRALRIEIWPRGEQQGRESYLPLLTLLSEACYGYRVYYGESQPACDTAKGSLPLEEPAPQWQEVSAAPAADPPSPIVAPAAIVAPSNPSKSSLGSMRQEPPGS